MWFGDSGVRAVWGPRYGGAPVPIYNSRDMGTGGPQISIALHRGWGGGGGISGDMGIL